MRLGNLAGQNRGKKYLKITGNELITPENQAKANCFAQWFSQNYEQLRRELVAQKTVDEDEMNETYLRIYDKILYGGLEINNYKSYYHRAFFTNYTQQNIKRNEIKQMLAPGDKAVELVADEYTEDEITERRRLYKETVKFIKACYTPDIYNVFFGYLHIGDRHYEPICLKTGLSRDEVIKIINNIRNRVRNNKELVRKRKLM